MNKSYMSLAIYINKNLHKYRQYQVVFPHVDYYSKQLFFKWH